MTTAEKLIDLVQLRLDGYDLFGVDFQSQDPWSYPVDEPVLLLLRLRDDINDIKNAKSDAEAEEIWEKIRPFILTFHIGGDLPH